MLPIDTPSTAVTVCPYGFRRGGRNPPRAGWPSTPSCVSNTGSWKKHHYQSGGGESPSAGVASPKVAAMRLVRLRLRTSPTAYAESNVLHPPVESTAMRRHSPASSLGLRISHRLSKRPFDCPRRTLLHRPIKTSRMSIDLRKRLLAGADPGAFGLCGFPDCQSTVLYDSRSISSAKEARANRI